MLYNAPTRRCKKEPIIPFGLWLNQVKTPSFSIHDHGAGGHLNCLSELVEETGGQIFIDKLPIGDPTLSAKEIIGNESQERMGFVTEKKNLEWIQRIAERERSPFYVIGETTGDHKFTFTNRTNGDRPIDMKLATLFGKPPRTVLEDQTPNATYSEISYSKKLIHSYLEQILQLESVGCKDWLTNKVDRSVTGRVAKQQCAGELQLPLNNLGAVAIDYQGEIWALPLHWVTRLPQGLIRSGKRLCALYCRSVD